MYNLLRLTFRRVTNVAAVLAVFSLPFCASATTIGTNISTDGTLTVNGNTTIGNAATDTVTITAVLQGASALVFEGIAIDDYETTFAFASLTGDRTVTFPDASGYPLLSTANIGAANAVWVGNSSLIFEGSSVDAYETTLLITNPTAVQTITFPDASGTVALTSDLAGSGATTALDNLASVDINASLISHTAATYDLGSEDLYWNDLFLDNQISFEGTYDDYQTTLMAADTTLIDKTITLPDSDGTVMLSTLAGNAPDVKNSVTGTSNGLVFEGTADDYETTLTVLDPAWGDNSFIFPDIGGGDFTVITTGNVGDITGIPFVTALTNVTTISGLTSLTIGAGVSSVPITAHLSSTITVGDDGILAAGDCHAPYEKTVTGAESGDTVVLGPTFDFAIGGLLAKGVVSAPDTVWVIVCNFSAMAVPHAAGTWRVDVWKH